MRTINDGLVKFKHSNTEWVLKLNDAGIEVTPYKQTSQLQRFQASLGFGPLSLPNIASYIETHAKETIQAIETKSLDSAFIYKQLLKTIKKHNSSYRTVRKIDITQQSFFNSLPIESKLKFYASKILDQNDVKNIQKIFDHIGDTPVSAPSLITLIQKISELPPFDQKDELINKIRLINENLVQEHKRQETLVKDAKRAILELGWEISLFIQNHGIDQKTERGQKVLIKIAKMIAQQDGLRLSQNIQKYGINSKTEKGHKALIEIAKLAAQQNGAGTSKFIINYGFDPKTEEGREALIEIAKLAALQRGESISKFIQNYGFDPKTKEGQEALIDIAKLAAQQDGKGTSKFIQQHCIDPKTKEGQEILIEIAKLAAQQNGKGASQYIQNYCIDPKIGEGQKVLIEIAKLAAQQNGGISKYIQKYDIDFKTEEGQKALIQIAKLAAQKNGRKTLKYIQNYCIDPMTEAGSKAIVEITVIAIKQNGLRVSESIQNFGIDPMKGQKARIQAAKLFAQQPGWKLSKNIQSYGIDPKTEEGQDALVEIAKLVSLQDSGNLSYYIQNYGFDSKTEEGKKALIEIAKTVARESGESVSRYIQRYGLDPETEEGQKALFEIAQLAAQQSGGAVSIFIQNYGFDPKTERGKKALIEIFKLAVQQSSIGPLPFLRNYGIQDKEELLYLYLFIFEEITLQLPVFSLKTNEMRSRYHDFETIIPDGRRIFKPSLAHPLFKLFEREVNDNARLFENLCRELIGWLSEQDFAWFVNFYHKIKDSFNQKRFMDWFASLAAICMMNKDLTEIFKNHSLLNEIAKRDPALRTTLTKELIVLHCEKLRLKKANEPSVEEKKNESMRLVPHTELASLVFARYPEEAHLDCLEALKVLKSEREFRAGPKQKLLIETLLAIKNCPLATTEKAELIRSLFKMNLADRLIAFGLVRDLIFLGGTKYLKEFNLDGFRKGLNSLFQEQFQVQVDDFAKKYESTIGTWRKKEALITYVGKLNELPPNEKTEALRFLKQTITWILDGNFATKRYETSHNPHLAAIEKNHPEIFKRWRAALQLESEEMAPAAEKKEGFLVQKIKESILEGLRNNHLDIKNQTELYPAISDFIKAPAGNIKEFIERVEKSLEPLSGRRVNQEEAERKKGLLIEKAILELFELNAEEEIIKKLNIIKSLLPNENEFNKTDIASCLNLLAKKDVRPQIYKTLDTDAPNDILLMGTEVENSCQRVDGDPDHNKCLLGYFLDGKHRLLLVKDEENKIVARSVLRLFVDEKDDPVLFQERVYVADTNPEYSSYLRKLALKKARDLGVSLVTTNSDFEDEAAKPFFSSVYAHEKPVPFEYVDALRGKQLGTYAIKEVLEISDSKPNWANVG